MHQASDERPPEGAATMPGATPPGSSDVGERSMPQEQTSETAPPAAVPGSVWMLPTYDTKSKCHTYGRGICREAYDSPSGEERDASPPRALQQRLQLRACRFLLIPRVRPVCTRS